MIFKYFNELPQKINFIDTDSRDLGHYEKDFYFLKILFEIKTFKKDQINKNFHFLTINPDFYFKNKDKIKLDLFIISVDRDNSHFINLIKYIKTNKLKKIHYKNKYFKKFLWENFPLKRIESRINKLFSVFNLKVYKYFFNKFFWIPLVRYQEDIFKGAYIGISSYNCYVKRNSEFNEKFKYVYSNLSDQKSKDIYKNTIYGKPSKIWRNYFNLLFEREHYQDYLYFDNKIIINLGVDNGFEIPFFATNNIDKILNIDPTGEQALDVYVKSFVKNFKDKILFDKSFLYDSKNVYVDLDKNNKVTNLKSIIDQNNCKNNLIIKSDIEGLEINLLDELEKIIPKYRPQLALSIYHIDRNFNPEHSHLVVIPKRLIEISKDYKFYINHYTYNRRETVFFCIPKEI